jgi:nitrite reductase/ring-hydroxylating ferredoxin subunit
MTQLHRVADRSAVSSGKSLCVQVDGRSIALFELDGTVLALDDTCTHAGGPLSEGEVEEGGVVCPWHGAKFDLRTGAALGPPASSPVKSYPVRIQGQEIWVELD